MNIDEIQTLWEQDSKIDPDNLHTESIKIPSLHSKYYNIYKQHSPSQENGGDQTKDFKERKVDVLFWKGRPRSL